MATETVPTPEAQTDKRVLPPLSVQSLIERAYYTASPYMGRDEHQWASQALELAQTIARRASEHLEVLGCFALNDTEKAGSERCGYFDDSGHTANTLLLMANVFGLVAGLVEVGSEADFKAQEAQP